MVQDIINQFDELISVYKELLKLSEDKFIHLKKREILELDGINQKEKLKAVELDKGLNALRGKVKKALIEKNINGEKLSELYPHINQVDKERLLACQQTAFNFEKKLKNSTIMNQCLVKAMMQTSQTVVDTWVHVANTKNQKNSFVNKKL